MSQATIALLIILFLGGSVAWWNGNRHDGGSHGGHAGYHQDGSSHGGSHGGGDAGYHTGGGNGGNGNGGGIFTPDPQQCS